MSPSERDLHRALSCGDDEPGVDVERIIAAGEQRRARRRIRVVFGAGGLIVVIAVGLGALAIRSDGGAGNSTDAVPGSAATRSTATGPDLAGSNAAGSNAAGSNAAGSPVTALPTARGATSTGRQVAGAGGSAPGTGACPAQFPQFALPGGGGTGQFGSGGALFARPVQHITVCGYGTSTAFTSTTAELDEAPARRLTASLEAAATGHPGCPTGDDTDAPTYRFVLLPTDADGYPLRTVTVELDPLGCPNEVTNGTAVRALWRVPAGFDGVFGTRSNPTTPGQVHGSPVRS